MSRNADLAKIHMGKKQLGLDDDTYRSMLADLFGVTSAGKLDFKQRYRLIRHMEERGAAFSRKGNGQHVTPEPSPSAGKEQASKGYYQIPASTPHCRQKRYIASLWHRLGYSMKGLDARAKRQFKVSSFLWLDAEQLGVIGKDLVSRCRRKGIPCAPSNT